MTDAERKIEEAFFVALDRRQERAIDKVLDKILFLAVKCDYHEEHVEEGFAKFRCLLEDAVDCGALLESVTFTPKEIRAIVTVIARNRRQEFPETIRHGLEVTLIGKGVPREVFDHEKYRAEFEAAKASGWKTLSSFVHKQPLKVQ